ncbi:hypothetical protein PQX77_017171 [Marasmius sp. AFHP31]|nr:hypothetical protein PQX77_017171 [Marasmius sp. AFHP31]
MPTPSRPTTPSQTMTPPPDPLLVDSAAPEADCWNPDAAPDPNITMDTSYPPALASLVVEPWKPAHTSQHEFYELKQSIADEVLFQVKLHGNMPAFNDRKYMYSHSSDTWFSIYFLQDSTTCVLAMDLQRIKGRLPNNMVIYPQQPMPKTNLPLMVTRGEFKDSVVTKATLIPTRRPSRSLAVSPAEVCACQVEAFQDI